MIELADLFHENRIEELTLSLILYVPFGFCLVLIRSFALFFLFIFSSILPLRFLNQALCFILTLTYVDETKQNQDENNRNKTQIIVSNRVSLLDFILLQRIFSTKNSKIVNLSKEFSLIKLFKLNSTRRKENLLNFCVNEIQQFDNQLIFQPECEPTTGSDGLLKFDLLPFNIAQKLELSIQPVCLRVSRSFQIRTTSFNSHSFVDFFWFLFSPFTRYKIEFLPIVNGNDFSSDENFCEKIRENMSRKMNIESTQFDQHDVEELKKRPDLFRLRHEQRRNEFQQMINFVHQQVPLASREAIRYDLETTKNVQQTIGNLNERVAAATRAANKSSSSINSDGITNSPTNNNYRQMYQRLKQDLIEKNRKLFLEKNFN